MIRLQSIGTRKPGGFMHPGKVLGILDLKEGMIVADFGCGAGYFSIPLAKAVGKRGKVYAIDILQSALESVNSSAKLSHVFNVEACRGNLEKSGGSGLLDDSVDLVVLANILFQSRDKSGILKEAKRVLKNNGRIVVVEWKDEAMPSGGFAYKVPKENLKSIIKDVGFVLEREFDSGLGHYGLIFSL